MNKDISHSSINEVFDKAEEALMSDSSLSADEMKKIAIQLIKVIIDPETNQSDMEKAASFIDQLDPKVERKKCMEQIENLKASRRTRSTISESDIVESHVIGRDALCIIYNGKTKDGVPVVVKQVLDGDLGLSRSIIQNEVRVAQDICHPYCCEYVGCLNNPLRIIYRSYPNDLYHLIVRSLTLMDRFRIAYQTACAIEYLQSLDLIHRDVKPRYIFIDDDGNVKLGGFHYSHYTSGLVFDADMMGTPLYMAPELLDAKPFSFKSVSYSFGFVLFELFTNHLPFSVFGDRKYFHDLHTLFPLLDVKEDDFSTKEDDGKPPKMVFDLMSKCCSYDPGNRPDISDIVRMIRDIGVFHVMHGSELEERFWKNMCCFSFKDRVCFSEFIECMIDMVEPHDPIEETLQMALSSSSTWLSISEYWLLCCCFPHFFCDKLAFSIMEKVVRSDWYYPSEDDDSCKSFWISSPNGFWICPSTKNLRTSPFQIYVKANGRLVKRPIICHSSEAGLTFSSSFTGDLFFENILALAECVKDLLNEKRLSLASSSLN